MTDSPERYRLSPSIKEEAYRKTLESLRIYDGIGTSTDPDSTLLIVPREVKEQPKGQKFAVLNVGIKLRDRIEIYRKGGKIIDP
jgi:hypothetical protein